MKHDDERAGGHRHARLQDLIFEELRTLLADDISDPTLSDVRFTAVVLSIDYRHARVHFAVRSADQRLAVERALARATPFFRARLAESISVKRVPDLRFVFDGATPWDEAAIGSDLDDDHKTADDA